MGSIIFGLLVVVIIAFWAGVSATARVARKRINECIGFAKDAAYGVKLLEAAYKIQQERIEELTKQLRAAEEAECARQHGRGSAAHPVCARCMDTGIVFTEGFIRDGDVCTCERGEEIRRNGDDALIGGEGAVSSGALAGGYAEEYQHGYMAHPPAEREHCCMAHPSAERECSDCPVGGLR